MPKGRTTEREVICKACRRPFTTDRLGKAATYCHTVECDDARERDRRGETREQQLARRQAREEREVRREMQAWPQRRRRQRRLQDFHPLIEDPELALLADEALEIVQRARHIRVDRPRQALRGAIFQIAHAKGPTGLHDAYQNMAALCLRLADSAHPRLGRESDDLAA